MSKTEIATPHHRRLTHVGTGPRGNQLFDLELDPARTRYHAPRPSLVTRLRAAVDGWWRGKTDGGLA